VHDALWPRQEVLEGYLFGSHARGSAAAHSDVDVAVYVDPDYLKNADVPFGYDAELASLLMRALRTSNVDLVLLNAAPPLLYHRVLRDGVRLFARDLAATTVREGRALSRWCDYAPQLAKIDRVARRANPTEERG
jgi:predicted nucleotidyltransferase